MNQPKNTTQPDRQIAEEAISHEEANFPESITGRKLVRQTKIAGGFLLLVIAVLFGLLVASFSPEEEPVPNPETPNQMNP